MKHPFATPPHATPIDISGLKIKGISDYQALSMQEAESIFQAKKYYFRKKTFSFTEVFIKKVHLKMFGEIWNWAGQHRKTKTNIGVKPFLIASELRKLCEDFTFWNLSGWKNLEVGARLHHRLVFIHPFENGNGRHARFVSDLYFHQLGLPIPKWPIEISEETPQREAYIASLKEADQGELNPLIGFIESLM